VELPVAGEGLVELVPSMLGEIEGPAPSPGIGVNPAQNATGVAIGRFHDDRDDPLHWLGPSSAQPTAGERPPFVETREDFAVEGLIAEFDEEALAAAPEGVHRLEPTFDGSHQAFPRELWRHGASSPLWSGPRRSHWTDRDSTARREGKCA